jgi:NAD(P)-dependent dehydrogenase (short-subunit alcohol dehydrogenase family)
MNPYESFGLRDKVALVTGGSGVLGRVLAGGLAAAGARVAIMGRRDAACQEVAAAIRADGGEAIGVPADVLDRDMLERAREVITATYGPLDILVNGAGGNQPEATTGPDHTFFDLDLTGIRQVFDANITGSILCSQVFGRAMAKRKQGTIINIASMASMRPMTRVVAYSAAKAALVNFTQWLAVHMAQEYSPAIRVNAIAPGFFLTEQNRFLLTDAQTGARTARGEAIIAHTPMGRFGDPADLVGTLLWLASPAAAFVTGIVVPVDGGFSAFGGV